jgi:signal transduction histidine kinase
MEENHTPILVDLGEGVQQKIYYDDSEVLRQLKVFPYIILLIFGAFALFSYLAMSNARRAEQNQVWVGLAKETAHQLGTPISSLVAWVEYLKENNQEPVGFSVINEIENDVERLTLVADRFSKIGAQPQLNPESVLDTVNNNVNYIKQRASKSVDFTVKCSDNTMLFSINKQLFNWVLENLFNNALDAMDGSGKLLIDISANSTRVYIDVADSGCGIPKGKHNTIFEPGFSTKRRGWGLGLSLTKRIVEEYHHGKIYVKSSELNHGTTFRIELPRFTETMG